MHSARTHSSHLKGDLPSPRVRFQVAADPGLVAKPASRWLTSFMSRTSISRRVLSLLLSAALYGVGVLFPAALQAAPPSGMAADVGVTVPDAWARASAGAATTGAVYVTLKGGAQPDQLIAASTPVAATADVHETINDNGVMKMRPVRSVSIPAHVNLMFTPGGSHIMLAGLKQPLMAGQSFPLTLTFAHGAAVTVDVKVRSLSGGTADHMHMQ